MAIQLKDVHFAYPKAQNIDILKIKSWSVSAQDQVFVHGPSGGGKSTLLNLLSGMLTATTGEVSVLGERLDIMNVRQRDCFRANHIGYIFQQFNLIPYIDAIDNIQLAHQFSKKDSQLVLIDEIKSLLSTFNISQTDWHKPVEQLSIGQQQRIAIARAMINKPQVLIADEPTSSLDQKNRDNFMSALMSLVSQHRITLLFVSHDMSLASYFSRIDALSDINEVGERS
jgi:putative ABC transport system ATP-binding protein|tara:strand:+ start:267 stop:947 length:681 start_codon:yes stop_codon:yes gene_type:complete